MKILDQKDNLISSIIIRALSGISNLSWIWDAGVTPTVTPARELDDKNSSTNLPAPIVIPNLPIRLQKVEYQSILNNFYSKRIIQRILQSMSFLIKYNLNSHWAQRLDVSSSMHSSLQVIIHVIHQDYYYYSSEICDWFSTHAELCTVLVQILFEFSRC